MTATYRSARALDFFLALFIPLPFRRAAAAQRSGSIDFHFVLVNGQIYRSGSVECASQHLNFELSSPSDVARLGQCIGVNVFTMCELHIAVAVFSHTDDAHTHGGKGDIVP